MGGQRIMLRNEAKSVVFKAINGAECGVADSHHVREHRCKYRLEIAGRAADNLEDFRGGCLLLQRLGERARALLLRLEQPSVLDRDYCLVGEGLSQLDLLVGEGPN